MILAVYALRFVRLHQLLLAWQAWSIKPFFLYNVIGGFLWAVGMTPIGYFLGSLIPDIDKYMLPIIGAIVVISVIPALLHMREDKTTDTTKNM